MLLFIQLSCVRDNCVVRSFLVIQWLVFPKMKSCTSELHLSELDCYKLFQNYYLLIPKHCVCSYIKFYTRSWLTNFFGNRLKTFNAQFEELHQRQSQWTVPDTELRESLRLAVAEVLLPAYRSFIKRFGYTF